MGECACVFQPPLSTVPDLSKSRPLSLTYNPGTTYDPRLTYPYKLDNSHSLLFNERESAFFEAIITNVCILDP